jgi:DNA topoisomerase VI subunit B
MPTIEGTIEDFNQQHSRYIVRGHLKKIVEIYDLEWRVVHELVQNAIDAIQANSAVSHGQVDLVLDIDRDEVTVTDNGTGFTNDPQLLCPNGTGAEKRFSSRSPAKGYQGVGLKAVMYSTTLFEIESELKMSTGHFLPRT